MFPAVDPARARLAMLMSSWAEMKAAEGSRKAASRNREGKVGSREEKVGRREEVAIGEKTGSKAATVGSWAVGSWAGRWGAGRRRTSPWRRWG